MEKISNIVRGSSRVASTDLKSSSAVRPGAPSFGRPVGESPTAGDKTETTAARAAAIQNEINETKRINSQDKTVQQMANAFFDTRIRGSEPEIETPAPQGHGPTKAGPAKGGEARAMEMTKPEASSTDELLLGDTRNVEVNQPTGYKPRGSYVDVHA